MAGSYVGPPPGSASYKNLNAAGSTLIKAGVGQLVDVTVNTGASGSSIALYDGTSVTGTPIATIDPAANGCFLFGVQFNTGLFAVVTGTPDITVVYN
jgi:hypothetical protein